MNTVVAGVAACTPRRRVRPPPQRGRRRNRRRGGSSGGRLPARPRRAARSSTSIYLQFDNTHYMRDNPSVAVRPRADAAPAQLPQGERDAVHERPHDPDLAHRGRHPVVADRSLPGSARAAVSNSYATSRRRDPGVHVVVQVLDRPGRTATADPLPNMVTRRRPKRAGAVGHRTRGPAATSAASRRRTSCSRTRTPSSSKSLDSLCGRRCRRDEHQGRAACRAFAVRPR